MKDTWKDYFSFNKRQRNGIIALLSFIAILLLYLFIADYLPSSTKPVDFSSFKAELEKSGIKSSIITGKGNIGSSQIDINSADTNTLMTLPKMTSYCARMIVRYRKKLGGYYSTNQLTEVWGMDSAILKALLNKVWADSIYVHKININAADIKELAYHPYIKYYLAKAIVNYREQHGLFASLAALHKMAAIDDSTYLRIIPYLTVSKIE
jgi:DNA uptake protein ComE-like DNA-binding protein